MRVLLVERQFPIAQPPNKHRRNEKRQRKRRQSLDGDGSWRFTTGERRKSHRRAEDQEDSPTIELPFLDDMLDADSANDNSQSDSLESTERQDNPVEETDLSKQRNLSREEQHRLHALKGMLDAASARHEQAAKNKPPVFAAGVEVRVKQGEFSGETGVILDADYIESRCLVSFPDHEEPNWIPFKRLGRPV